jgi:hypothetical protein
MEAASLFETLITTFKAAQFHDFEVRNSAKMPVFVYFFTKFGMIQ